MLDISVRTPWPLLRLPPLQLGKWEKKIDFFFFKISVWIMHPYNVIKIPTKTTRRK